MNGSGHRDGGFGCTVLYVTTQLHMEGVCRAASQKERAFRQSCTGTGIGTSLKRGDKGNGQAYLPVYLGTYVGRHKPTRFLLVRESIG